MNKIHYILFTLAALLVSTSTWAAGKVTFKTYSGPKITAKYSATGNTIVETTSSGATSDITSTNEVTTGALVTLTIDASNTQYLSGLTIQAVVDAGAAAPRRALEIVNTISYTTKTKYVSYEFVMPNYDVWITPTFADRTSISTGYTINLAEDSHTYDWQSHSPVVNSVTPTGSTAALTEGTDYTLSYSTDNGSSWSDVKPSITDVSESIQVKATGTGEYKEKVVTTYTITARPITGATIMLLNESYVYKKGTKQYSTIDRVYLNGNLLSNSTTNGYNNVKYYVGTDVSGVGYDATDDNFASQNVGTYSIKITGTGNYTGTATKTYTITKRDIATCTVTGNSYTYDGSAQYPTTSNITVSDGYGDLDNTDYDIKYWNGTAWVTTPTLATTEIGAYTFKLEGKGNNYSGSKEVPYYINSNNNIYISYNNTHVYTGSQITATDLGLVVKDGGSEGTTLTYETHYDVVYSNNTNVGPAQFTVIGRNGYNFYYTKDFSITPKSVNAKTGNDDDITITLSETSFTYNTSTQKPTVTVKDGDTPLVENKDYTLVNAGGVNVGTYHATIRGLGNYDEQTTKNSEDYSITALSFSNSNTTITLSNTSYVYNGDEKRPEVVRVVIDGNVIPSADYQSVYSDNTNAGTATVRITKSTTSNNLAESNTTTNFATQSFTIERKSIANVEITLDPSSFTFKNGVTQKPTTVTVVDKERGTSGVTLTSTDYTLTNEGGIAAGVYDVIVTGAGNYIGSAKKSYVINETAGSTAITIADIADQTYTGTTITPTPTITYTYGENQTVTLQNNTHYTLSYINNTNVGEATVIVTLKGGYTGSATKTFNIVAKSLAGATVTPNASFTYNGNVQKPSFVVVVDSRTLDAGVDYNVTYNGDAISAGTQNVTINGIGNYKDTKAATYTINKLSLNTAVITLPATRFEYSRGAQTPTPQVKVGNFVVPSANYDVRWDNDADATNTPDVTNIGEKTVYVTGKTNCDGSKSTDYVIVAKQIDASMVTLTNSVMTYTGSALDPGVVVTDKGDDLQVGTEYAVELTNNTKVGTATVTVTGQGNYTGVVQKTFVIKEKDSGDFTIAAIAAVTYNGSEYKPTPAVYYGTSTTPLTINTDYTLSYINNVNAGTAIVTVTGKGGYAGSTGSQTFTINPKTLTSAMVTLSNFTVTDSDPKGFTYNGNIQKPSVTVSDGTTAIITSNDYTISNEGNINVGNYTVTVTATTTGNYSGSVSKNYAIYPYTLNATNTSVILDQSTFVYDRTAKKPNVLLVKVGDTMVVPTFTTAYSNNVNAGNTATVTVTGSGNFTGSVNKTFVITPKPVSSDMIRFNKENFIYNEAEQKPVVTIKDGETTMTPGTATDDNDYTLTNEGGTNVGVYYVYIDGHGNYTGRASRPFYIITQNTASFVVSDIPDVVFDGTKKTPSVTVSDNNSGSSTILTENVHYTVSYINNTDAGIATVIITGMGSYAGTVTKNFNITPKPLAAEMISVSPGTFTFNGSLQRPDVTVTDGTIMKANDYTVINSGNVNQGTYYVTVIGQGNYKGTITNVAQTKYTITPLSIAEADVNLYDLPSYVYDGTAKNPSVREVLVNNYVVPTTGYDVSYGTNIVAGPASITITGKGNFTGTKTVNFTIAQKDITSDMILLSNTEYIYTGELKKPEVTVKQGETTLTLDTDYTLSNNGGIYVGQYNVTVTGKGNYTGTASQTYNIIAQEAGSFVVTLSTESVVYTGGEQKPAVTVKKGDVTLNEGTDYTVMYIDNINVGMAMVTVRGKGNYEGTVNKTFFITPKTLTGDMVTLSASSFTYNGVQQRPGVTVSDHDFLTSNDYYITNEGGVNIGSYNVIITGKSNYTGTVTKQFSITPLSLNDANIVLYEMASNIYDGKPKNPGVREVTVGTLVVPTTGYTTSVSPNINVGTVTVTVTGKDNFTGSAETTFVIMPKPLTSSMMTLTPTVFNYNGTVQKPSVTVKDGKVILTEDTDYTLTNEGGKEAETYEVTVKGIGNYTDEATQSFIIVSSGANTFVVTLETSEYTFDGTAHKPAVTVTMEERTLSEGTDYTLTYSKNTNAGTALVTVKGVGDYTGEQVKTFTILPKALTDAMVTLDKTSFIYNEKVQKPEVTVADGTIMTADDYTVTNDGGTDEGTYQVVVTGQNNYKGVVIKSFTITREEIHGDDDPGHPDEKPITYTPTEEGSDEVKVSSLEGSETELEQITSVTIPATCTANGKTYSVVGVSANAFANVPNLTDIYLPDTEEPLEIAEDAIPTSVTVHTTLALLDDYALMPSLSENFKAGKIKATVTAKNRYWTFSSGVDVYVPDGVSVYIVHERNNAAVTIVELSDNDLTVGGQRIIKHNNGVLIGSDGNETPYDLVACGRRMSSGSTITTDDFKDYGSQNCLVTVIVPTHFDKGYYFLRNNEFYSIQEEGEDVKVPAGKAVLYLHQAASSPSYSSVIQLVNTGEITNINGVERDADEGDWYDMSGRKLNGRPTKKGVYIQNNKKIVIR